VGLREVDADLKQSLGLSVSRGAFVQDVTGDSPAARAGVQPYDVIVSLDGKPVTNDDELIAEISRRSPGSMARLTVLRNERQETLAVRLVERPGRDGGMGNAAGGATPGDRGKGDPGALLGLTVRDLDAAAFNRLKLPSQTRGVLITRVEPLSSASDGEVERSMVLMEINRKPVESVADYRRIASAAHAGDILALYVYIPDVAQRKLLTVRIDDR
jgi:serine protease Do